MASSRPSSTFSATPRGSATGLMVVSSPRGLLGSAGPRLELLERAPGGPSEPDPAAVLGPRWPTRGDDLHPFVGLRPGDRRPRVAREPAREQGRLHFSLPGGRHEGRTREERDRAAAGIDHVVAEEPRDPYRAGRLQDRFRG